MDDRDMKLVSKCAYLLCTYYVYVLRSCPLSHDTVLPCYSSLLVCKSFSEAWSTRYVCTCNRYCVCVCMQKPDSGQMYMYVGTSRCCIRAYLFTLA